MTPGPEMDFPAAAPGSLYPWGPLLQQASPSVIGYIATLLERWAFAVLRECLPFEYAEFSDDELYEEVVDEPSELIAILDDPSFDLERTLEAREEACFRLGLVAGSVLAFLRQVDLSIPRDMEIRVFTALELMGALRLLLAEEEGTFRLDRQYVIGLLQPYELQGVSPYEGTGPEQIAEDNNPEALAAVLNRETDKEGTQLLREGHSRIWEIVKSALPIADAEQAALE